MITDMYEAQPLAEQVLPLEEATTVTSTVFDLWQRLLEILPTLLAALVIFFLGWLVAATLGAIARNIVRRLRIDEIAAKTGVTKLFKQVDVNLNFAGLIGWTVKWFFIIAFLIAAADVLGWTQVTVFLKSIALYIPNVIIAVIILAIGIVAGQFVDAVIRQALTTSQIPPDQTKMLAKVGRVAVIVFAVLAALTQLGIASRIIEILFAGIVLALALAFGLGGREKAATLLSKLDSNRK